jgi:chemotaxis protein methyltransferase CheR
MEIRTFNKLSTQDFERLSRFIFIEYGIKMNPLKKTMLESRLQKRLHALQLFSFREYCNYLFSPEGQTKEIIPLVNVITTNKTDFFRESAHFNFLSMQVLPELMASSGKSNHRLQVWSAGCSTGEEPYTLAMVISEFAEAKGATIDYQITGTDLSTQVLQHAINAVYTEERAAAIPQTIRRKYFLRSKDSTLKTVRIIPELRRRVSFQPLNFMDTAYDLPVTFDIVFCRNVLIYFDRLTQEKVINRLCARLKTGGYFFLGHSESVSDMQVPLRQIKPTVFIKV